MAIVGRKEEQQKLERLCESPRAEFAVVYGRRRVGKTFLVREFFGNSFAFYATGVAGGNARSQLASFNESLIAAGGTSASNWFEAFRELRHVLESPDVKRDVACGKRVAFIDELPWLDAPRTDFMAAFELFWNQWGSAQKDFLLITCGSAASWVVRKLFQNRGGLHNRVTARIHLEPFTLKECEEYYSLNGHVLTRAQMVEGYMVFGGIPFYLDLLDRRLSMAQNIDALCFSRRGELVAEFDELYRSLFKHADRHIAIVHALSAKARGLSMREIADAAGVRVGGTLTSTLADLEASGFVRSYAPFGKKSRGTLYQLVDPFSLFYLRFMNGRINEGWWGKNIGAPRVNSWRGYAFELVCLLHERQIEQALGIAAISSDTCSWRSAESVGSAPSAQIDLVIDRADGIIDLCEMKWSTGEFVITKEYDLKLRNKLVAFAAEAGTRKALHLAMVTPYGVKRNAYRDSIQADITLDVLFE